MAIQKSYNLSPSSGIAIDASQPILLSWQNSGDLQTEYSISVHDNSTGTIVYSFPRTVSYTTSHTIPASTLLNGKEFKWQVTVWNQSGQSATSDFVIFQTSSKPVLTLTPIGTVASSTYTFDCIYSQAQAVAIRSWICYLYDSTQKEIANSGIQTSTTISHQFTNLESNKTYYIEFQATSNKGITSSTGKVSFNVLYTKPNTSIYLTASNIENAGIELSWFVINILGRIEGTGIYVNNEKLDVTNGKAIFDSGVSIENSFTLKMWLENPEPRVDLLVLKSVNGTIRLQYDPVETRFIVYKKIDGITYEQQWWSESVNSNKYFVCLQQINNGMNIRAENWA